MNLRRLPILRGKHDHFPFNAICPACRRKRVFEPHSFAIVSAGALMKMRGGAAGPAPRLKGFWGLAWHGVHDRGSDEHPNVFVHAPVAESVDGGQCEIYLCSTRCLRRFFTDLVDELDRRIQLASKGARSTGRRRSSLSGSVRSSARKRG